MDRKANKDLVATAKTKDAKPKRYYKLILSLVIVILISIYMIQSKRIAVNISINSYVNRKNVK